MKRVLAAVFGVFLGLALIGPIQAQRLTVAICNLDVEQIFAQMQHVGWSHDRVEYVAQGWQDSGVVCTQVGWRGMYINSGLVQVATIEVDGETTLYSLKFDLFGQLEEIR